jgi:hypothetical protein
MKEDGTFVTSFQAQKNVAVGLMKKLGFEGDEMA